MFTLTIASVALPQDTDLSQYPACSPESYAAWIARVKKNQTPVAAGAQYLWIAFQAVPPKVFNCVITVKPEDAYPPPIPTM